ncbi:hypothetical protein SLEP1_g17941 [Rubroshorea leprosula]|uniref:Uncharacterized protein n=1 Tax=Rubroshorea leprosula TaxID=152421 RepID=A0AAV5J1S4_9ROSI|nr:hypothetical protein SLEP1_g17941 [Rubroshorea leprosula]
MKTLATSCSKTFIHKYGDGGFKDLSLNRHEVCFLPPKMAPNPRRFFHLVSVQHKSFHPVLPSASLLPESEACTLLSFSSFFILFFAWDFLGCQRFFFVSS